MNQRRRFHASVWGPLICLLLNISLFMWIEINHPEYLRDYRINQNPDATHYVLLGRNILLRGEYSRASEAPYVADVFRTPGYPLFVGVLDIIGGAALIYLTQALLQTINCAVIGILTTKLFGKRAGLYASLLCATDMMLAVLNFEALSEPLYVLLISTATLIALPRIVARDRSRAISFLLAGLLLGIATYVRPAGLYLPVIYAIITVVAGFFRRRWSKALLDATLIVFGALILIVPWMVRNQMMFGIPHLTTNDTIVLVYFTGAGAYQLHHGVDLDTAQQMIAKEFGLRPPIEMWNYWKFPLSPREMDEAARAVVPAVLGKYPLDLVKSSVMGVIKASVSHNAGELADILGKTWTGPSLYLGLRLDPKAITRLFENHPGLIAMFMWQSLYAVCLMPLALCGFWRAVHSYELRITGVCLVILETFFVVTLGASGLDAYSRFRSPILPLAYVSAGYAWRYFFRSPTKWLRLDEDPHSSGQ